MVKRNRAIVCQLTWLSLALAACSDDGGDGARSERCRGGCEVTLDTIVTLGSLSDSVSPSVLARAVRTPSGEFLVGGTDHPGEVAIYSRFGRLVRTIGRGGTGPLEFPSNYLLPVVTQDGFVQVVDLLGAISIELDEDLNPAHHVRLPFRPLQVTSLGNDLILQSPATGVDGRRYLIHQILRDGTVRSSVPGSPSRGEIDDYLALGTSRSTNGLWISARDAYRLTLLDSSLVPVRELALRHPGLERAAEGSGSSPAILGMVESDSLLWVLLRTPNPSYTPPSGPRPLTVSGIAEKYHYLVEAVDVSNSQRVASLQMEDILSAGPGDGLIYGMAEAPDGRITMRAYRPKLRSKHDRQAS